MKIKIWSFLMITLLLVSCGSSKNDGQDLFKVPKEKKKEKENNSKEEAFVDEEIIETFWVLEEFKGKKIQPDRHRTKEIGFELSSRESQMSGFGGCNSFSGKYHLKSDNQLRIPGLMSTRMACPQANFDEPAFLGEFENIRTYEVKNKKLTLKGKEGEVLATFKAQEDHSDLAIVGKYWKLTKMNGTPVKMSQKQEREVYFIMKGDSHIDGFDGCNKFNGKFTADKKEIAFSHIAGTLRACPDINFKSEDFLNVFFQADTYKKEGDDLKIYDEENNELAVFEAIYFD